MASTILRRTLCSQLTLRGPNLTRTSFHPVASAVHFSNSINNATSPPLLGMPQTRAQTSTIIRRTLTAGQGEYVVEHDVKNHKFVIKLDPDNSAFIDYEQLNNSEVLLYHTEVPELYGGKGIGQVLADVSVVLKQKKVLSLFTFSLFSSHQAAFAHFERAGQKMVITCTYLQKLEKARKAN